MNKQKINPVLIIWEDSQFGSSEWKPRKGLDTKMPLIKSSGFIIKKTKKAVLIVQSMDDKNKLISQDLLPSLSISDQPVPK